jgi:DNA-binding MarR family transcriptional regulator
MQSGLAEQGLTRARAEVIWTLGLQGSMTQRQLSEALRCTPRNVTGLLDGLQAAGLVSRSPHPTDRRATLVSLTTQGAATASRLQAGLGEFAARLFGDVSDTSLNRFVTMLDHVLARIRADD